MVRAKDIPCFSHESLKVPRPESWDRFVTNDKGSWDIKEQPQSHSSYRSSNQLKYFVFIYTSRFQSQSSSFGGFFENLWLSFATTKNDIEVVVKLFKRKSTKQAASKCKNPSCDSFVIFIAIETRIFID